MRIMQIVSGTSVNGAIYHCLVLSRELARRGHRVTVVCRPESWIGRQLLDDPVDVVKSDLRRWPPGELRRVAAIAQGRRVNVLHTHMSRAHFFGVLVRWLTGIPCVATAQSRHFQLHWMFNDRVIAVSEATRRYQQRFNFVRPGRLVTIHNFIGHDRMAPVPEETAGAIRRSLGFGDASLLMGVVGQVGPRKGQLDLVRAMPEILSARPNVRLILVGRRESDYWLQINTAVQQLNLGPHVLLTGPRSDVREILAALNVFVLPSHEESFPLALLEAMAARLPVVATTAGGIPECVRPGETGILVRPGDVEALGEAVLCLVRDPGLRRRYGEAGRRRVQQHFSPESQTAAIEAALAAVRHPQARAA